MPEEVANSVLIVDDSPEQIRYVSEILKPEGCRIYAATSCMSAFCILEKHIPDLMILDIVMPEMDGFTFCKKIKADKKTADIPIIFATAYNDKEYIGQSFAVGGSDYVVKPFIKEELLERVKSRIQLSQKNRELKRAYAELDKFCYTVSHDIRAPLYVIKQLAELLKSEMAEGNLEEIEKICGMLVDKAAQAATMTEGLHRFSKVFYEEMKFETVDMEKMFREVYNELCMIKTDRNIVYKQGKLPQISGDATLLHLVVQNILSNAIKFTRERTTSHISVKAVREGDNIVYEVSDDGIGFDQKQSEEVFSVFRKLHSDVEYEGDGIGLASARRIVLRHGGDVEMLSKLGEGCIVRIILPMSHR